MRKFGYLATAFFAFAIVSCDKVSNPYIAKAGPQATLPTTPPDHVTKSTDSTLHKALLEDYMGHFCTNCPAAVAAAESAVNDPTYGKQIVAMEINVDYNADTAGEPGGPLVTSGLPDTAYKNDYRTAAGTAWYNTLLSSSLGVPAGMISRIYYDASYDQNIQYSSWATVADSIDTTPQNAVITMVDSSWIKQQVFGTAVTVTLKNPVTAGAKYFLEVVLVEDSILDWQKNGSSDVQYFVHHKVLRTALNGAWGDSLSLATNIPVTKYYAFTSPKFRYNSAPIVTPPVVPARLWNMAKCSVIAFLYQRTYGGARDYYVLQAQELHL